jgi:hypothetical protein
MIHTAYSGKCGGVPSPRAQQRWSCCSSARRGAAGTGAAAQDPQWRGWRMLTVKIRQPSHEFTFGVGMNFIPYPLVLTPVV